MSLVNHVSELVLPTSNLLVSLRMNQSSLMSSQVRLTEPRTHLQTCCFRRGLLLWHWNGPITWLVQIWVKPECLFEGLGGFISLTIFVKACITVKLFESYFFFIFMVRGVTLDIGVVSTQRCYLNMLFYSDIRIFWNYFNFWIQEIFLFLLLYNICNVDCGL